MKAKAAAEQRIVWFHYGTPSGVLQWIKLPIMDILDDVFDLRMKSTEGNSKNSPEYLAVPYRICLEITINLPISVFSKKIELIDKINLYKNLFEELKKEYNVKSASYEIEYCKSGEPHMHAYIECFLHSNFMFYEDEHILKMFAKSIFKKLPKKIYIQLSRAKIDAPIRRLKTAALCLNLKNIISQNWENYIKKNA